MHIQCKFAFKNITNVITKKNISKLKKEKKPPNDSLKIYTLSSIIVILNFVEVKGQRKRT